jgi:DNA-binding response OmpR family regulator
LEDDQEFRELMQVILSENAFEVIMVNDGVEGIDAILSRDFDLILCDIQMPTLPGEIFYRTVSRMRPQLSERFIFMTGCTGNPKVKELASIVGGMILRKPFEKDDLMELIAFVELRTLAG